jgi:hypothetical protein
MGRWIRRGRGSGGGGCRRRGWWCISCWPCGCSGARNCGYGQVMLKLADGLYSRRLGADLLEGRPATGMRVDAGQGREWRPPNPSSLSRGRGKLGPGVLRYLFERVAGPLGADEAPGALCCGLRIVSMGGSVTDVPDGKENDEFFGRPSNQSRNGAFSRVRWVVAAGSGTGGLLGASLGGYRASEQALALDLLEQGCFGPGMLVLADRRFLSWQMARDFLAAGARILRRASASFTLKPVKVLQDGAYLAELGPPRESDGPVITVRVIECSVPTAPQGGGTGEVSELFCPVTDLIDQEERPALGLACRYPERWGCETVIGHHETDMGEGRPVLRSKDPAGVMQEMWALFAVYQAICRIVGIAVNAAGVPPAQISFPHALAAAKDPVAAFPPWPAGTRRRHVPAEDPHARIPRPGPARPRQPPQIKESRRLPRPETRRAQRHQRRAENRVPLAQPLADHLKQGHWGVRVRVPSCAWVMLLTIARPRPTPA